ncbi:MAG: hypothetical protein R2695_07460 [Acidimicrobiales bacterium]
MAIWAVVGYIDWKYVDLFSFVSPKTPSRFGGMQYDPNNAGAAYAVALIVAWTYGPRAFRSPATRLVVAGIFAFALSQTYSRTGELGAVAGILAIVAVARFGATRWARYFAIGGLLLGAAYVTGIVGDSINEWDRRPDTVESRAR